MCFSPTASFVASGALTSLGAYCARQSWKTNKQSLPLAMLPLLFGVQQLFEGFVWLAINAGNEQQVTLFSYLFLFFAFGLWPFYCPFIVLSLEEPGTLRKKALLALTAAGAVLGILVYFPLVTGTTLFTTTVVNQCIAYETNRPASLKNAYTLAYFAVTVVPFLIASNKRLLGFGALLVLSIAATLAFYRFAFFSVWCFFAAWLSLYIAYALRAEQVRVPLQTA